MKSYSFILILLLLWGIGLYAVIHFDKNDERILRVGVECDYAPQNWEENKETDSNVPLSNKNGFYAEGYDVQIAKIVAKSIGAKLEVKRIEWGKLLPALNENEIDAIFSSMLDTEERKKVADFSTSYELRKTIYTLVLNKNSKYSNGKKLSDFSGAKIIGQAGSNLDAVIDQIPGVIHAEPVADMTVMIEEVLTNDIDGFVIDLDTGQTCVEHHPELVQVEFPEGDGCKLGYTGVCAAVRKSDRQLLSEINVAIDKITLDERMRVMDEVIIRERDNT